MLNIIRDFCIKELKKFEKNEKYTYRDLTENERTLGYVDALERVLKEINAVDTENYRNKELI